RLEDVRTGAGALRSGQAPIRSAPKTAGAAVKGPLADSWGWAGFTPCISGAGELNAPWTGAISEHPQRPSAVETRQDRAAPRPQVGLQPACPPYSSTDRQNESRKNMNIFSIIGVVVVVLVLLGYFGFR